MGSDYHLGDHAVLAWGRVLRFLETVRRNRSGSFAWWPSGKPFPAKRVSLRGHCFDARTLCALLRADRSAYRFGGVTLAIVLLIPRGTNPPWQVALTRFAEVSVGIGVALLFATVWPEGEDPSPGK